MALLFEDLVSQNRPEFIAKVKQISNQLAIDPNWLMMVMYLESYQNGVYFNPKATNSIGATGLIQFIPSTLQQWGFTPASFAQLSNVQQLDYVLKFYANQNAHYRSYTDLHLYTFFPQANIENWKDNAIFPNWAYEANKPFDLNKDQKLTLGEWKEFVKNKVRENVPKEFYGSFANEVISTYYSSFIAVGGVILLVAGLLLFFWYYYKGKK